MAQTNNSIWCPAGHEFKNPNNEFNLNGGLCVACQKGVNWSRTEPPKCSMCGKHFPNEALMYSHVAHAHQIAEFDESGATPEIRRESLSELYGRVEILEKIARADHSVSGAPVHNGNCPVCGGMTFTGMGHLCPREFREPTLRDRFAMAALTALGGELSPEDSATASYEYADAMMIARKVKP